MKPVTDDLYKKIVKVSIAVRNDFRKKGLVIPVENLDGSVSLDNFTITKDSDGFYVILNSSGEAIVDQINLPQTAAVVANGLALGRFRDDDLIKTDKDYGYALFEEMLHERALRRSAKKPLEHFELMLTKCMISRAKKEHFKSDIVKSFEKLRKLV
jgi:hypothetical protein